MDPHLGMKAKRARECLGGYQLKQWKDLHERKRTAHDLELGRAVVAGLEELHWFGPSFV